MLHGNQSVAETKLLREAIVDCSNIGDVVMVRFIYSNPLFCLWLTFMDCARVNA